MAKTYKEKADEDARVGRYERAEVYAKLALNETLKAVLEKVDTYLYHRFDKEQEQWVYIYPTNDEKEAK